ncbi:fumarylacetoacetate hydrolase family protein [Neisseriaceae bacterium CLB008]|nr:fumarylacetoacetate hydrolase family protein [Neisseriaceae bacterium]
MKKAKIQYQNQTYAVTVNDDLSVNLPDGTVVAETDVTWLPPATGTMFALGLNYADHASELAFAPPTEPLVFIKSKGTYVGHRGHSWRPNNIDYMHYECELAAVIGKTAKNVKAADAWDYVEGFTLCNDYAIRDYLENYYRPNLRVKNRDAMTPVGPYIIDLADVADPMNLSLKTWVNGELRQEGNTKDMIFDVPFLIEYLSSFMTLQPGDMIATGCPKGTSDVKAGDTVIIEIEQVGSLTNYMLTEDEFFAAK